MSSKIIIFSLFRNYLLLEKGGALHLNKIESPHPRLLCAKFGWNWPSGSGEEDENVKSLQTDRQTGDGRQVIRKAHLSFQLRWAKKPKNKNYHIRREYQMRVKFTDKWKKWSCFFMIILLHSTSKKLMSIKVSY